MSGFDFKAEIGRACQAHADTLRTGMDFGRDEARREIAQRIAQLELALEWCVNHPGECLGDHPARLAKAKAALQIDAPAELAA